MKLSASSSTWVIAVITVLTRATLKSLRTFSIYSRSLHCFVLASNGATSDQSLEKSAEKHAEFGDTGKILLELPLTEEKSPRSRGRIPSLSVVLASFLDGMVKVVSTRRVFCAQFRRL